MMNDKEKVVLRKGELLVDYVDRNFRKSIVGSIRAVMYRQYRGFEEQLFNDMLLFIYEKK